MVREEHKGHIILWERKDGGAYMHISKADFEKILHAVKNDVDVDDRLGYRQYKAILRNEGYDL